MLITEGLDLGLLGDAYGYLVQDSLVTLKVYLDSTPSIDQIEILRTNLVSYGVDVRDITAENGILSIQFQNTTYDSLIAVGDQVMSNFGNILGWQIIGLNWNIPWWLWAGGGIALGAVVFSAIHVFKGLTK